MKIEIVIEGHVVSALTTFAQSVEPAIRESKKQALKTALDRNEITISQSLRASFRVLDDAGERVEG